MEWPHWDNAIPFRQLHFGTDEGRAICEPEKEGAREPREFPIRNRAMKQRKKQGLRRAR